MATQTGQTASTRIYPLRDQLLGGVDTTLPAHLLGEGQWRTQHNLRLTPTLTQLPRKIIHATVGEESITWLGLIPQSAGFGKLLLFTPTRVKTYGGTNLSPALTSDSGFRRWSVVVYNGNFYYTNELNSIRRTDGLVDVAITGAPKGRYLAMWYDHLIVGYPTFNSVTYPSRVMVSALGYFQDQNVTVVDPVNGNRTLEFKAWTPAKTNEADYYDFLEWQQPDYPFIGVTGLGKLRGVLWVYTPTAIVPLAYVGLPKVFRVEEQGIVTRVGNTFPWTLVMLDQVHFFYDGIEKMFWAFDGQTLTPIGEPVRAYMQANLNTTYSLASRMYGFVDVDNREVWWPFCSTGSSGDFDLAVVFNYRYKKWYTASVEKVFCFCGGTTSVSSVGELAGLVNALTGTVEDLGTGGSALPRLYGSTEGHLLREELSNDSVDNLLPQDTPTLESPDFHYGDIRTTKENDLMVLNASWDTAVSPTGKIVVKASGRDFLGQSPSFTTEGDWTQALQDGILGYQVKSGRVLRYKFELTSTRGATVSAFSEGVYAKRAEK